MSTKGGQTGPQDGGLHAATHGNTVFINGSVLPTDIDSGSTILGIQSVDEEVSLIQDGGQQGSLVKGDHVLGEFVDAATFKTNPANTIQLDGLGSTLTLDGQTLANTEWLKSKIGNLGGVFVIQNGAVNLDGVPEGSGFDLTGADLGDVVTKTNMDVTQAQINIQETVGIPIDGMTSILMPQEVNMTAVNNVKSLQSNVVALPNLNTGGQHQRRVGDIKGKVEVLPDSYKACLYDIEQGSELTFGDKELLENDEQEFQSMEFQSLNNDKSNTLMTPQELELMPERGIEFEESVGPKEDFIPESLINHVNSKTTLSNSIVLNNNSVVSPTDQILAINGSQNQPSAQAENSGLLLLNHPDLNLQDNQQKTTQETSGSDNNNGGLLTMSIATDNAANSTQILINTPQGQQIFQINTADLNKATSAIQPLALQGGIVGKDASGKIVNSGTVNGITVEDGYLVIPMNDNELDGNLVEGQDVSLMEGELSDDSLIEDSSPPVPGRVWLCNEEGCGKTFNKLSKLKIHLMRHTGEKPFKCSVPDCEWAFTTAYKLKRHEESHQKKKDFECDIPGCGRKFTTIYNLNTHRKLHERPCTEECPDCGLKFPTMRKLDLHMKNHIGAQKNYKCPVDGCNKMFFSPHCMGSHTRVHQENRDLTCHFEGCGKVYDKLCRLKQHMRTHTGEKPYVCTVESCGWAFSTASKLKRHERKHTGERKWVCPVEDCGKAFMRAEHLKGHLVTHSGERPFICQVEGCGARFTAKSSMYVHIKKHNEPDKKVTYFCPLDGCHKKFNNKVGLRGHIAKHYQNALAQANAGDLSNIIPILSPEDIQEGLEGLMAAQADLGADASHDAIVNSVNSILPTDTGAVDQTDLIVSDDGTLTTVPSVRDLCGQTVIPGSTVTQLVVTADGLTSIPATNPITNSLTSTIDDSAILDAATSRLKTGHDPPSEPSTTLFTTDLTATSLPPPDKSSGSARTDYCSNRMLVDRAKKRRKLMKNSLEGADSNSSIIDMNNFQDLSEGKSSLSVDNFVPTSAADSFPVGDLVSSAAITFRDPETGAIYVQTQLLQDDPPNPTLYSDDTGLDESGQSVLTADLPAALFHDANTDDVSEFTSTTINLQDLE